jgi:hypothetical protein
LTFPISLKQVISSSHFFVVGAITFFSFFPI